MAVVSCESRHRPPGPRPSSAGGPLPPRRPTWPSATNRSPARLCRPAYFRALAGPGPPPSTLAEQPSKLSVRLAAGGGQETDWTARCPSSRGSPPSLALAPPAALPHLTPRLPPSLSLSTVQGTASTLTRSEVQGGGKKPYAQKGTGNARQGSRRTPLRPGGGITFGPKPRDWGIKMNKKERRLALGTALQSAAADTLVVDAVSLASPKTSERVGALARLGADPMAPGAHVLLLVEEVSRELAMASRNVAGLTLARVGALNAYDVLRADRIVVEKGALAAIQDFYGPKAE